uniref:Uncharacterized protein n=1 Tax=Solanum lycopersicum TaxID=4081 RepID=A0A3Q7F9K8_SOLLC
ILTDPTHQYEQQYITYTPDPASSSSSNSPVRNPASPDPALLALRTVFRPSSWVASGIYN